MIKPLAAFTALLLSGTAYAQDVDLKPLIDARLRYEHVDQNGIALSADAITLRVRAGGVARWRDWSALVEGEGTLALADNYNDGTNGKTAYPLVVDLENLSSTAPRSATRPRAPSRSPRGASASSWPTSASSDRRASARTSRPSTRCASSIIRPRASSPISPMRGATAP